MCSESPLPSPESLSQATVYVLDDDATICEALKLLFESVGLRVHCFRSAATFLEAITPQAHGCVVLDVRLPGMSGLEVQATLTRKGIRLPVILLTGYADVSTAICAMKGGAFDFLEKPLREQVLLECVWRAINHDVRRKDESDRLLTVQARFSQLSPREREVLALIVEGKTSREIAVALSLSTKTIENHRARIMEKTQANGLADLVRMCWLCQSAS